MKAEYNFSKGTRGKFYKKGAVLRLPIYLDPALQKRLESIAKKKGVDVSDLVDRLLRRDLELVEELS